MYSRDLILNETQKLAQILAKLLGLKNDGNELETQAFFKSTLTGEFGIEEPQLLQLTEIEFKELLSKKAYRTEQLDALAKLFYYQALPLKLDPDTLAWLQKALIIFDVLEKEHHTQSFDNIPIRKNIDQFIKDYHA
jgi:hypothetical protein